VLLLQSHLHDLDHLIIVAHLFLTLVKQYLIGVFISSIVTTRTN